MELQRIMELEYIKSIVATSCVRKSEYEFEGGKIQ